MLLESGFDFPLSDRAIKGDVTALPALLEVCNPNNANLGEQAAVDIALWILRARRGAAPPHSLGNLATDA